MIFNSLRQTFFLLFLISGACPCLCVAQENSLSAIATDGWSANSVNAVIFRKNALVSDGKNQFAAYYDTAQFVVLAKRRLGTSAWTIKRTKYQGDATDAHKSISIMVDGKGFLHMAWGQHNNQLNYVKGIQPRSLEMGAMQPMLNEKENKVSYPEFYRLADGDLLFLYRDGGSGNGNLMINRYITKKQQWIRVQDGLIDGEGKRNAYWQAAVDEKGGLHLSWVWRESPDVASNHDLCYAKSDDGGKSWKKSDGQAYRLPIRAANAEYAVHIPQKSELINQTSMFANGTGQVYIATYWRDTASTVPQYHLVYKTRTTGWQTQNLGFRKTPFSLSGGGTKQIPVSRPQIIAWNVKTDAAVGIIFRDIERGNKVSMVFTQNLNQPRWKIKDLNTENVGDWEPSYDTTLWFKSKILHLWVQKVIQVDGEGKSDNKATPVQILEWKP